MAEQPIIYGVGLLFPLRLNGAGDFASGRDEELLKSDLQLMFATSKGELDWDDEQGMRLHEYLNIGLDDSNGGIEEELRHETADTLAAADGRLVAKTLLVEKTSESRVEMTLRVGIRTRRGVNPVLRDVEERIRLR